MALNMYVHILNNIRVGGPSINNKTEIQPLGKNASVICCPLSPSSFVGRHVTWAMTRCASRELSLLVQSL